MKTFFRAGAQHTALLVFFNGWGMDEAVFGELPVGDMDVLEVSDYRRITPLTLPGGYQTYHLAAWSLGVVAAAVALAESPQKFASATAVNGTLNPVDDDFGIPVAIFNGTLEHWESEAARSKFFRRAGIKNLPRRTAESQKEELIALKNYASRDLVNPFASAVVGLRDRIIPPAAQLRFWKSLSIPVSSYDGPHGFFERLTTICGVIDFA